MDILLVSSKDGKYFLNIFTLIDFYGNFILQNISNMKTKEEIVKLIQIVGFGNFVKAFGKVKFVKKVKFIKIVKLVKTD